MIIAGAAVVALSAAPSATAVAQEAYRAEGGSVSAVRASASVVTIEARLKNAKRYAEQGSFVRARHEFEQVAMEQRARGELPYEALSHLAGVQIAEGRPIGAAETLEELGRLAEIHGQLELRAAALLEAARLYRRHGRPEAAVEQLGNLVDVLGGPGISAEVRNQILARMGS